MQQSNAILVVMTRWDRDAAAGGEQLGRPDRPSAQRWTGDVRYVTVCALLTASPLLLARLLQKRPCQRPGDI